MKVKTINRKTVSNRKKIVRVRRLENSEIPKKVDKNKNIKKNDMETSKIKNIEEIVNEKQQKVIRKDKKDKGLYEKADKNLVVIENNKYILQD